MRRRPLFAAGGFDAVRIEVGAEMRQRAAQKFLGAGQPISIGFLVPSAQQPLAKSEVHFRLGDMPPVDHEDPHAFPRSQQIFEVGFECLEKHRSVPSCLIDPVEIDGVPIQRIVDQKAGRKFLGEAQAEGCRPKIVAFSRPGGGLKEIFLGDAAMGSQHEDIAVAGARDQPGRQCFVHISFQRELSLACKSAIFGRAACGELEQSIDPWGLALVWDWELGGAPCEVEFESGPR